MRIFAVKVGIYSLCAAQLFFGTAHGAENPTNGLLMKTFEFGDSGVCAASVEAVKSTDGNPWREARAELAASASGEVALEVADPLVKADFDHPDFQAWGTTFNEMGLSRGLSLKFPKDGIRHT